MLDPTSGDVKELAIIPKAQMDGLVVCESAITDGGSGNPEMLFMYGNAEGYDSLKAFDIVTNTVRSIMNFTEDLFGVSRAGVAGVG